MWKQGVFGVVAGAFLGYVVWIAWVGPTRHQVEWDVALRVEQVLEQSGFDDLVPVVDGRDVELQGNVQSIADAARAERIVEGLRAVREVHSELTVGGTTGLGGGSK